MTDVGVRELKQRLSEYLDRAQRGEVLRVTDRGRPKAVLGPLLGRARIREARARATTVDDLAAFGFVELDEVTCEAAAQIAELTGARTARLATSRCCAAAWRAAVSLVTFDVRQARAARLIGLAVPPA